MSQTWKAPAAARSAARRALEVRASKPPSQRGMIETGLARARQLINNEDFTENDIRTMYAWFRRHAVDKQGSTWSEQGKGWQAWHGWGGDSAYAWVSRLVRQLDKNATKTLRIRSHYRNGRFIRGYEKRQPQTMRKKVIPGKVDNLDVPEHVAFPALYKRARRLARQKYDIWPSRYGSMYMVSLYEKMVKAQGGKPYRT